MPKARDEISKNQRSRVAVGRGAAIIGHVSGGKAALNEVITEWNIQSRAHACSTCAHRFADKEAYHTLLYEERSELRRLDLCQACWGRDHSEGGREKKGFVSYWHGIYEAPPAPTEAIQKATAESLLRQLIELNDPYYIPAGYILAVMLERKRILRVKEQIRQEGRRVFVYEQPKTGDIFTITDPELQLTQLEQVQKDVAQLLEHGLPAASQTAPAPPGEEAPPPADPASALEAPPAPAEPDPPAASSPTEG